MEFCFFVFMILQFYDFTILRFYDFFKKIAKQKQKQQNQHWVKLSDAGENNIGININSRVGPRCNIAIVDKRSIHVRFGDYLLLK
jgi:hypothetical protein